MHVVKHLNSLSAGENFPVTCLKMAALESISSRALRYCFDCCREFDIDD